MRVKAIAFDGHGVIYHRPRRVIDVLLDYLEEKGLTIDREEAESLYLPLQREAFVGQMSSKEMIQRFCDMLALRSFEEELLEVFQKASAAIELEPGLREVLERLRRCGLIIGMITNSVHPVSIKRAWLRQHGIEDLFDVILSSADEAVCKPSVEIFRRFASRLSLAPEEIVFVGHDEKEIKGAKAAGMVTVCFRCKEKIADFCITSLKELLELSRTLATRDQEGNPQI